MKTCFAILGIFYALNTWSQTKKTYASKNNKRKFYVDLQIKTASADVKEIFNSDKDDEFAHYVDGPKEEDVIDDYGTVIHELFHGYCNMVNDGQYYFIDEGIKIEVPYTKTYRSKELNTTVRKGQQDSITRYGIYVGAKDELPDQTKVRGVNNHAANEAASIQKGVYGLLEEFSAYYFGTKAMYQLKTYYAQNFKADDANAWYDFKHGVLGNAIAYHEFSLFMGWYLWLSKEKHPEEYSAIMANKPLRVVYTIMDEKFNSLLENIDKEIVEINKKAAPTAMEILDFSGSDEDLIHFLELAGLQKDQIYEEKEVVTNGQVTIKKQFILPNETVASVRSQYTDFIAKTKQEAGGGMMLYYGAPERQMVYLKRQYSKEIKQALNDFRLEGATQENYTNFLK
jgi:hypothetical protein